MVERDIANVEVVGSRPIGRSMRDIQKEYIELMGLIERNTDTKILAQIEETNRLLKTLDLIDESRFEILEIGPIEVFSQSA